MTECALLLAQRISFVCGLHVPHLKLHQVRSLFFNLFGIKVRAMRTHVSILMEVSVIEYFFCSTTHARLGLFEASLREWV